jgi:hypothetical protein
MIKKRCGEYYRIRRPIEGLIQIPLGSLGANALLLRIWESLRQELAVPTSTLQSRRVSFLLGTMVGFVGDIGNSAVPKHSPRPAIVGSC